MKNTYILFIAFITTTLSYGQIFITEIADPRDGFQGRYTELYNAGATAVDLGVAGYRLQRYTNDATTVSGDYALTGTIAAGGFFIIGRPEFEGLYGFAPDLILDGTHLPSDSNGDDKIVLVDNLDEIVDVFGVIGELSASTCHWFQDGRVERIATVSTGNSGTWNEANWNVTGVTVLPSKPDPTGCTNHTVGPVYHADGLFDPGAWIGATNTFVSFATVASSISEGGGTIDVCVSITNPDASVATTVDISLNASSTVVNGSDFTAISFPYTLTFPAGSSADQCLTIAITNDSEAEAPEDINLELQNIGGGTLPNLGSYIKHTVTIENDITDVIAPNVGDIIVTEIMQNPTKVYDSNGEWFEVYNTTAAPIDMNGWELSDHNSSSYLDNKIGTTIVPAGGYLVLAVNDDSATNGDITVVDYQFVAANSLGNSTGIIKLTASETVIDQVDWSTGSFPLSNDGMSMELASDAYDSVSNDDSANWGLATEAYGDGDFGTPGTANDFALSVGLNEIEGFEVYPNPINTGVFRINSLSRTNKTINLYDVQGKNVFNSVVENNELIDVSILKSGIYVLRVVEGRKLTTLKLIIK